MSWQLTQYTERNDNRNICAAWLPSCAYSAITATKFTHAFELCKVKKKISHFLINNICQKAQWPEERTDGLLWRRETVSCGDGFPPAHGCHGSILPPSSCAFYQFSSFRDWKRVHGPLHTGDYLGFITNEWGRPLKPFTETLERDWAYFHPVIRLGMKSSDDLKKSVWTGSKVVFTFVAGGKIKAVSSDCGFGGYLIFLGRVLSPVALLTFWGVFLSCCEGCCIFFPVTSRSFIYLFIYFKQLL